MQAGLRSSSRFMGGLCLMVLLAVLVPARTAWAQDDRGCVSVGTNTEIGPGETRNCDFVVVGADLVLANGATVNGDVLTINGNLQVADGAKVNGDVNALMGDVSVAGQVAGSVFGSGKVNILPTAVITGSVNNAENDPSVAPGASIGGAVGLGLSKLDDRPLPRRNWRSRLPWLTGALGLVFFGILFAALIVGIAPAAVAHVRDAAAASPWTTLFTGLVAWVAFPFLMALVAITVVGLVAVPLVYLVAAAFGLVGAGEVVGRRLMPSQSRAIQAALGAGLFAILFAAGAFFGVQGACVSFVAWLGITSWSLGAALLTVFGTRAWPRQVPPPWPDSTDLPLVEPSGPSMVGDWPPAGPVGAERLAVEPAMDLSTESALESASLASTLGAVEMTPMGSDMGTSLDATATASTSTDDATAPEVAGDQADATGDYGAPATDMADAEPTGSYAAPFMTGAGTASMGNLEGPGAATRLTDAALPGVTPIFAHLLAEAGLQTLGDLASAAPERVLQAVSAPGVVPVGIGVVSGWIASARALVGGPGA